MVSSGVTARHTSTEELPSQDLARHLPHHLACTADRDHLDIAYRLPQHIRNGFDSLIACVDHRCGRSTAMAFPWKYPAPRGGVPWSAWYCVSGKPDCATRNIISRYTSHAVSQPTGSIEYHSVKDLPFTKFFSDANAQCSSPPVTLT